MANTDGKRRAKRRQKRTTKTEGALEQPFDPGTALEVLHGAMISIQALSAAAVNSLEFMPRADDARERRQLAHTYSLVVVLDEEIGKAVAMGDEMVPRLGKYLKKRET